MARQPPRAYLVHGKPSHLGGDVAHAGGKASGRLEANLDSRLSLEAGAIGLAAIPATLRLDHADVPDCLLLQLGEGLNAKSGGRYFPRLLLAGIWR